MFANVVKDVQTALYASSVQGIVYHYAYHLRLLTTYGAIASSLKIMPKGGQMAQALAQITEDLAKAKQPIATAVVVNQTTGMPGSGFFTQCRALRLLTGVTPNEERSFWEGELRKLRVAPLTLEQKPEGTHTIERSFVTSTRTYNTTLEGPGAIVSNIGQAVRESLREQSYVQEGGPTWTPADKIHVGDVIEIPNTTHHTEYIRGNGETAIIEGVRILNDLDGHPVTILKVGGREFIAQGVKHLLVVRQAQTAESEEPASQLPG
jgi:hypothetical protein